MAPSSKASSPRSPSPPPVRRWPRSPPTPPRPDRSRPSCSASRPRRAAAADRGAAAPVASIELTLHNEHGLHARPAARFVETVRRFDADVTVRNLTTDGPTVSGRSVSALSTLGVPTGDQIEVSASGRQAREALAAIAALVRRNFDEPVTAVGAVRETKAAGPTAASPGIGIGPKTSLPDIDDEPRRHGSRHDRRRRPSGSTPPSKRPGPSSARPEITSLAPPESTRPRSSTPTCSSSTTTSSSAPRSRSSRASPSRPSTPGGSPSTRSPPASTELTDPYLRSRADDIRAVGDQVLAHLRRPRRRTHRTRSRASS